MTHMMMLNGDCNCELDCFVAHRRELNMNLRAEER